MYDNHVKLKSMLDPSIYNTNVLTSAQTYLLLIIISIRFKNIRLLDLSFRFVGDHSVNLIQVIVKIAGQVYLPKFR